MNVLLCYVKISSLPGNDCWEKQMSHWKCIALGYCSFEASTMDSILDECMTLFQYVKSVLLTSFLFSLLLLLPFEYQILYNELIPLVMYACKLVGTFFLSFGQPC